MAHSRYFTPRVALITGASAGFGEEFARQLAPQLNELHLVARRGDRLEALRAELTRPGLEVICHVVDLTDSHATEEFLQRLTFTDRPLSLLVNNAGMGDHGDFAESEWAKVDAMLKLNVSALTRLTHALLPELRRASEAAIINISSLASFAPLPGLTVYAATKAYVSSFSEGLRGELRETNIRVTAVCPGPVHTEFFDKAERPGAAEMKNPDFIRIDKSQVVREALAAMRQDRPRIVPGWIPFLLSLVLLALPLWFLRPILGRRR